MSIEAFTLPLLRNAHTTTHLARQAASTAYLSPHMQKSLRRALMSHASWARSRRSKRMTSVSRGWLP